MLRWAAIVSAGNDPAWDRGWGQRSSEKPPPEAKEIIPEGGLSKMNQTPVPGRVLGAGCQCTDARRPLRGSQPGDPAPPAPGDGSGLPGPRTSRPSWRWQPSPPRGVRRISLAAPWARPVSARRGPAVSPLMTAAPHLLIARDLINTSGAH